MKRILSFIFIILISIALVPIVLAQSNPTVTVEIYRVQKVDPIEIELLEDGADWNYKITLTDSESSREIVVEDKDKHDSDIQYFYNSHPFENVKSLRVTFQIDLYESDLLGNEIADISDGTRKSFEGIYDLRYNSLDVGTVVQEGEYYKTSGDFDGSTGIDENDAHLWFKVTDTYEQPIAEAGNDQVVGSGEKVNFDGSTSFTSGSSVVSYQWDFDSDGIFDAEGIQTSYTYPNTGTFTVTLKVTDNFGETSTDTALITVSIKAPDASFSYDPLEPTFQTEVNFFDTSVDKDGNIVSWYWDFGDGTTSTSKDPSHKFSTKGEYQTTLTVTDNDEAKGSVTHTVVVVNMPPEASFECNSNPNIDAEVQFTDKSSDPENMPLSWFWDFGDGYTSEVQNPTHKYASSGNFDVALVVTDDEDETDTFYMTVSVAEPSFTESLTETAVPIPMWIIMMVVVLIIVAMASGILLWIHRKKSNS